MINQYILGTLEDITGYFVFPHFYDLIRTENFLIYGFPYGLAHSLQSYSEPLLLAVLFFFARFFSPINIYNLFVVGTFLITFLAATSFFKQFITNKALSGALAILYTFSPYLIYHSQAHPQLTQIWLAITFLTLHLTWKQKRVYKYAFLGLLLGVTILTSNYIGFFSLIFFSTYSFINICVLIITKAPWKPIFIELGKILLCLSIAAVITLSWAKVFFGTTTNDIDSLERPIGDFVIFSPKPWSYILPPADNFIFGNITKNIVDVTQSKWGYFWTQNYFKSEISPTYIGISNLILIALGCLYLKQNHNTSVLLLGLTTIILIFVTLPPYFTINTHTFYLPSFLVWKYFPMFRVLARGAFLTYLIVLLYSGLGVEYLINKYKKAGSLIACFLICFSFAEHLVPFEITKVSPTPQIYQYIKTEIPSDAPIVIYPLKYTDNAFYWMSYHAHPLINPNNYQSPKNNYIANDLSNKLNTCIGIMKAKSLGAKYAIVFSSENDTNFFVNTNVLKEIKRIPGASINASNERRYVFLNVNDATVVPDAIIYEFVNDQTCHQNY